MGDHQSPRFASASACLALVEQSPSAVAAHDRDAWLALFADECVVEDPVGSRPHVCHGHPGRRTLGRFYDTFIAPNTIRFLRGRDLVCGLHVMRDLELEIAMSPAVTVRVPMHLLYELTDVDVALRIARLAAHWELGPMLKQQMAAGLPFLRVGAASALRMLRYQGPGGMAGFAQARGGVGEAGKQQVAQFQRYFNRADRDALGQLFLTAEARIGFPYGTPQLTPAACVAGGGALTFSKVLAAGRYVTATAQYAGARQHEGVALFEFDLQRHKIADLRFYW